MAMTTSNNVVAKVGIDLLQMVEMAMMSYVKKVDVVKTP